MSARIAISGLATALLIGGAAAAQAAGSSTQAGPGAWGCTDTGSKYSSAASSGPAVGTGVPNDLSGRETSSPAPVGSASPSAAASGAAVGTDQANDLSGRETDTTASAPGDSTTTVGRSSQGMDERSIRQSLAEHGYTGFSDLTCNDGAWTFRSHQNGTESLMRVDPETGTVESQ
ncbi:MAG: hypothetical protein IRY94_18885 [Rhodospirillaceae bacterium]|nr:hypothetical protein [Rhodospirillaceae bacterium]